MEHLRGSTKQKILSAAKKEFLQKGFRAASLRNIVREAGVTTGALYGYYESKEALFRALAGEPAKVFLDKFKEAQNAFAQLPPQQQPQQMGEISGDYMDWMVDYVYDNFDAFRLILCCSQGTEYEHFVHTIVEIEVEATHRFVSVLECLGRTVGAIDPQLEHILVSGMFSAFFEMVVHDMPKAQAVRFVKELLAFYTAGWKQLMGL